MDEETEKLIKEGIDLSSDVMEGIYKTKKSKTITIFAVSLAVVIVIAIILCAVGYPAYGVSIGCGGLLILIVLLVHNVKKLQGLKRELDALNHYISY